jgi:hypothetical protein
MGCGLALAGPQGGFQFFAQTVVFPLEPFLLPLQFFDLLLLVFDLLMGLIQFLACRRTRWFPAAVDELAGPQLLSSTIL